MKNLILKHGLIAGSIIVGMLVLTFTVFTIDFDNGELLGYSTMIVAFATIFIAIKTHRDKHLNGVIGFGKAFKIGLGITLVASAIYILSWMIMSNTIAKDFMSEYFQHSVEQIKASNLSEAEIEQKIAEMDEFKELYKNPIVKIGMTFLEIFPVGLLVSLIASFILKKGPNS